MKEHPLFGTLELDVKSEYSHIRICKINNLRLMLFVRDSGEEAVEGVIDLDKPHKLLAPYTRYMFLSYLFCPKQERVLFVGLGIGAMIQFLKHFKPKVHIDIVEIDPVIIELADRYFDIRNEGNINIVPKDGFEYLTNTEFLYDAIYIDAFLKPSRETDCTGAPLQLHTPQFYKEIQKKLKSPDGLVVFNINHHANVDSNIKVINQAFSQTYMYLVNNSPYPPNLVLLALLSQKKEKSSILVTKALELEHQFEMSLPFRDMLRSKIGKK